MNRIAVVSVLAAGLLVASGVAWAQADKEPDTWLTYGYDPDNHVLVYGTEDTDDCSVDGPATVGYGMFEAGMAVVESLMHGGEELVDAVCGWGGWLVDGPQGQVNHGMVVRTLSHSLEGGHKGCLMRWVAQSQFGKGEQQVRTPDVDPAFEPGATGEVDFMTQGVVCHPGNGNGNGAEALGTGKVRGNSADAPGHNK